MAEQISHNVVNEPKSTGGSLPVDAVANQTTTDSAAQGIIPQPTTAIETVKATSGDASHVPIITTESATSAHATTTDSPAGVGAAKGAAEPSAGEAVPPSASAQGDTPVLNVEGVSSAAQSELANGVQEDGSQADDNRSTADISVDVSVASDTENSRAELDKKDGGPVRASSVKKPLTFSKVNVTKSFLNKAAPTTTLASGKLGEKPSPATAAALTAKVGPRLVAKAGSSLQNLQKPRAGSQSAAGPDASKVWNKNRPVQQPPPKQFTDEELKQQYGIHLATRLQADEGGNDNKWADIDDDEDDWAPEAVVWMDGTKSTVAPLEPPVLEQPPQPQPTQIQARPQAQVQAQAAAPSATSATQSAVQIATANAPASAKPTEGAKPILTMKRNDSQTMKILKPGAAAIQAKQNGASGPGTEKPSLKAKSPAPPQKSPWAPVPKPDAVSPIIPPTQMPRAPSHFAPQDGRLAPQDGRVYDPPPPVVAREIAADTFDRSWQQGEGGARELFNSTNGRYEPAPEGRRSSVKHDSSYRKPAVLQRPSHTAQSPAEPSAAFQSRTSTQMDGSSWGRRRGSSVSQGSNPAARRMSMVRGQDSSQIPEVPFNARSPASVNSGPAKPNFAQQSAWDQQMPARPAGDAPAEATPMAEPALSVEDQIKAQERVMKERRELAKKRRQEEEQAEQAAKQERLRAKLAALEGAGKSKKEREAEAAAASKATASAEPTSESVPAIAKRAPQPQQTETAQPLPTTSQPAAQQETQARTPAAESVQKPMPVEDRSQSQLPTKQSPAGVADRPEADPSQKQSARVHLSPAAGTRTPYQQQQQQGGNFKGPTSSFSSPGDRKPTQPFGRSPNNLNTGEFTPWPTTAPSGNVWGTAGIGNGTFESSSAFAPLPMNQQGSSLPPPPGMGRPPTSSRISPQGFGQDTRSPNMHQQQVMEQQRAFGPPGMDQRSDPFNQSRHSPANGLGRPSHPPGPIGPPSRTQQQPIARTAAAESWGTLSRQLPGAYSSEAAAAAEARRRETGVVAPPSENRFQETFKKTLADEGRLGARSYESTEVTVHDASGVRPAANASPAPPSAQTQPPAAFSGASSMQDARGQQGVENTVKIPHFSQPPAHNNVRQPPIGRPQQYNAPTAYQSQARFPTAPLAPAIESKEQSPPPPETGDHPVNDGADTTHPHVRLPRPQVKVRLPPLSPSSEQQLLSQQAASGWGPAMAPSRAARPIVMNKAWQARFNGLFNRTGIETETPPSPPKTPPRMALAPASLSRVPYDDQATAATVSLPQTQRAVSSGLRSVAVTEDIATKPTIDRMFNEELSFGSMPKVKVPRNTDYNLQPAPVHKHILKMGFNPKMTRPVESLSSREIFFEKAPGGVLVTIPGSKLVKKLCPYLKGYRKPSGTMSHHQQERKPSGKFNKQGKGKEVAENIIAPANGTGDANTETKTPVTAEAPSLEKRSKSGWNKPSRTGRGGHARGGLNHTGAAGATPALAATAMAAPAQSV